MTEGTIASRGRIPISRAEKIGKEKRFDQVIILGFDRNEGEIHLAAWGANRKQCKEAGEAGEIAMRLFGVQGLGHLRLLRASLDREIDRREKETTMGGGPQ